jgi:DUF4097 and DUF4098 domain-containing protein YvlB
MASYPPSPPPPPGYDPRDQRRFQRDQFRAQMRAQRDAMRAQRDHVRFQMRSLRRGSVLGPILLIAIGVLFLLDATGRLDHQRFWEWYGHWWPVLLVAAGVVLLAEWAFDQFHMRDPQRPPYRRTLGGGVFLLLLILGFAGYAVNHIHDMPDGHSKLFPGWHIDQESLDELFGDKHESDETMDLSFAPGDSLTIANPRGAVTVSGSSDDNQMHLAIHKQIYANSDSDADSKLKQFNPDNKYRNSAWTVTMPSLEGASADLVISVPASTPVSITTDHGDIHIASVKAAVSAIANHGDVDLSAISGAATAHINSGSSSLTAHSMGAGIAIEGHAQNVTLTDIAGPVTVSGEYFDTRMERINGNIHYHTSRTELQLARLDGEADISQHSDLSIEQAAGPVVLSTSNHNVTLERIAGDIAVTDRNGTIELNAAPPIGVITLEDRNGSVKLVLPERAGFSVQANTSNGDVYTDFPLPTSGSESHKNIIGTEGAGGPMVHITTSNGDITIDKGTVLPLPPLPPALPKITLAPAAPPHTPRAPKNTDKP